MTKKNLSEREVNEHYGLGRRQLRMMRMRGTGPLFIKTSGQIGKRGGRILYPVADLESWIGSRPSGGGR
jgi:hypothetical protein